MHGPEPSKYGVPNPMQLLHMHAASETRWIHQEPVPEIKSWWFMRLWAEGSSGRVASAQSAALILTPRS